MRESTRILMTLNLGIALAIIVLGLWMPESKMDRVWLWLTAAAFSAVLIDRKLDRRL